MIPYIVIALFVGIFAFEESGKRTKLDIEYFHVGLVLFLLIVGLHYHTGDYGTYEMAYNRGIDVGGDKGYFFLQKLFSRTGVSFQFFIFITTLLSVFAINRIYRISLWPSFGLAVILGKFFTLYAMSGIRQYLAMIVCWLAISELLARKRTILFFILVLLAYTLHGSAIIILPVFFLRNLKFSYVTALGILIAAFVVGIGFSQFYEQVSEYSDFIDSRFGSYYRLKGKAGVETMNMLNYAENLLFLIFALLTRKKVKTSIPFYDFFLYMFVIYCGFLIAGNEIGIVKRLRDYYGIAYAFVVPSFVYLVSRKRERKIVRFVIVGYFIFLMFRSFYVYDSGLGSTDNTMIPYKSIFELIK